MAFTIVSGSEPPIEARNEIVQHCRTSGLKERRRLIVTFYSMTMELDEHPRNFLLRMDRRVKEMESVERPVDPKIVDVVIPSGSSDEHAREWVKGAVTNQYHSLETEKPEAGVKALMSARGSSCNPDSPATCVLCSRAGHNAATWRRHPIVKHNP